MGGLADRKVDQLATIAGTPGVVTSFKFGSELALDVGEQLVAVRSPGLGPCRAAVRQLPICESKQAGGTNPVPPRCGAASQGEERDASEYAVVTSFEYAQRFGEGSVCGVEVPAASHEDSGFFLSIDPALGSEASAPAATAPDRPALRAANLSGLRELICSTTL